MVNMVVDRSVHNMPYKSKAQQGWAHTPAGTKALGGAEAVKEWDKASKGKHLPAKLHGNGENTMSQGMKYYNTPSHAHNVAMNALKKNTQPLNLSPQNLPSSPVGRMPL